MAKSVYHTITKSITNNTIVWLVLVNPENGKAEITLDTVPGERIGCTEYMVRNNQAYYVAIDQEMKLKDGENTNCLKITNLKALRGSLFDILDWLKEKGINEVVFQPADYQRYMATIRLLRGNRLVEDGYNPRTYIKSREFVGFITISIKDCNKGD
jgi:hypothetical protein